LKILLVNTRHFYGGGDSIYALNQAALLRSQGHETAFFAMRDGRNLPDPNEDLFVSHIDFKDLNSRKNLSAALKVLFRVIYSREARGKFRRLLARFRPDVVHLHNIHGHITPSVVLEAASQGIPVAWTLHDYKLVCPNSHFLLDTTGDICESCGDGKYYPAISKRCKKGSLAASMMACLEAYGHRLMGLRPKIDRFLTPSAFLQGKMIEGGFPAGRVTHVPLFLPDEMFLHAAKKDQGYLLFLGKLEPLKGIHYLLQAAHLAPQVKLILAGGAEEAFTRELRRSSPANVEYVGRKDREGVKDLLQGARALVLPSIWYENQPLVILEAFAAGKPVIASDLGGMTELVKDGERGLLVPPGDVDALAGAMRWMAENPREAQEMGRTAQRYAYEVHSAGRHYERLREVYNEVCSKRNETVISP
jgi:glycosyltransferase involved in cell wall biosynthesis